MTYKEGMKNALVVDSSVISGHLAQALACRLEIGTQDDGSAAGCLDLERVAEDHLDTETLEAIKNERDGALTARQFAKAWIRQIDFSKEQE